MSSSDARSAILGTIAGALGTATTRVLPDPSPVFAKDDPVDPRALAREFSDELWALSGETRIVRDELEITTELAKLIVERDFKKVAAQDAPRVRKVLDVLSPEVISWSSYATKDDVAAADCGVIEARALAADCGAVLAFLPTYAERLLPYLPRTCIVIAQADQLHAHLRDGALTSIALAAREEMKGEAVLIAGPSKSADIERILVFGAHGPQNVIVFISGVEP